MDDIGILADAGSFKTLIRSDSLREILEQSKE
jgi:hypothetical protein